MLEGELDAHLSYENYSAGGKNSGNSRNGKNEKKIKSEYGEAEIEVPRDRNGSFDPVVVPKRSRLSKGIENLVISLFAKGMSNSDIEEQLREIYDFRLSASPRLPIPRLPFLRSSVSLSPQLPSHRMGPFFPKYG